MSCKVISFMNMKGGVGKTTVCVNLAHCLSEYKDKKVLVIDLDPQSNTSQYMLGKENYKSVIENNKTIFSIYSDIVNNPINYNVVSGDEDSEDREIRFEDIVFSIGTKLDIIPGDLNLVKISQGVDASIILTLKNFLDANRVLEKYNYIFIDCPPTQSIYTSSALIVSDYYILPVKPDFLSSIGIDIMKNIIKNHNRTSSKKVKCLGIILNMVHKSEYEKAMMIEIKSNNLIDTFADYITNSPNISKGAQNQEYLLNIKGYKQTIKKITDEFINRIQ